MNLMHLFKIMIYLCTGNKIKEGECSNHRRINMITENELMLKILI